jgi:Flp pilus assembly protein TadB
MKRTSSVKGRGPGPVVAALLACLVVAAFLWPVADASDHQSIESARSAVTKYLMAQADAAGPAAAAAAKLEEDRLKHIEEVLNSIQGTGKAAEERSLFNKIMALKMVQLAQVMVALLVVIAVGFPLTLWFLARRRVAPAPGLSQEIAETLVVVEERQAKLVSILRDIQSEIDYVQSMSVPDLKKLIEQAEKYIEQNERDLTKTGLPRTGGGGESGQTSVKAS